jgi:hypothetical protein
MNKIIRSGGGLHMNKVVKPPIKTGGPNRGVNPGHVSQLGTAVDPKAVEPVATRAMQGPKFGNEIAGNSKSAPGQGRAIMPSGTQRQHGPVAGQRPGPGRDILNEFGPNVPGRK